MATWNYDRTSTFSGALQVDTDGNIIGTEDSDTYAGHKTFSIKGFKTPTEGQTDTTFPGTFGSIVGGVFGVSFDEAKAKPVAILEE